MGRSSRSRSGRAAARTVDREPFQGFAKLFKKGTNIALIGPKDSGKSWIASRFSSMALRRSDYIVASNILCQRWVPAEDDPESGTWEEAYPTGYHKVTNFYRLFWVIESALRLGRTVLFVLDEAGALAKGMRAGEIRTNPLVRDNLAFMGVSRHLNVCAVTMAQSLDQMGTALRSQQGGILDYVIRKPSKQRKELLQLENEHEQVIPLKNGPLDLAHPKEWAMEKPGRVIYADSMAAFDRGYYPGTHIMFRLDSMLDALSDQLPDRYPEIIREHLEWQPPAVETAVTVERVERAVRRNSEPTSAQGSRGKGEGIMRDILAGMRTNDIARKNGCSGGTVTYWRKQLALRAASG